jgi:hypothetical protein
LAATLGPETIWMAAIFIVKLLVAGGAGADGLVSGAGLAILVMRGSAQVPSIWNCCVLARASGSRRKIWARKVPMPMAGLMATATSEAVPALISGTTTTRRSCVSRARSAGLPSARRR